MSKVNKLLFFDIDGTLTFAFRKIPDSCAAAIAQAKQKGCKIFVSTGRPQDMIDEQVLALGLDGGIYSAGAKVIVGDKTLYDRPMTQEEMSYITSVLDQADSGTFTTSELLRLLEMRRTFCNPKPVGEYGGEPIYKITFMTPNPELIQKVNQEFGDSVNFVWFGSPAQEMTQMAGLMSGEVSLKGIDKGAAVLRICEELNVPVADTIAFGDSMNDAAMLKTAGIGVAMGNADDTTKAIADYVTDNCEDDGVAKALMNLGIVSGISC